MNSVLLGGEGKMGAVLGLQPEWLSVIRSLGVPVPAVLVVVGVDAGPCLASGLGVER